MLSLKEMASISCLLIMFSATAQAQGSLNIGVSLNGSGWSGDNGAGDSDFSSDKGGQFGFSIGYNKNRYYTGLSLQGGEYQFEKTGPAQFTSLGKSNTQNVTVKHNDFDLLAGYYLWDKVSLFIDIKAAGSQWSNNDYEQNFTGLGFGVAGYHPLNETWTLYGSWGFVGGKVREVDDTELGDAVSNALTVGFNFTLTKNDRLNLGLKFRSFEFEYDDGSRQQYSLNGLFVGYNHVFSF